MEADVAGAGVWHAGAGGPGCVAAERRDPGARLPPSCWEEHPLETVPSDPSTGPRSSLRPAPTRRAAASHQPSKSAASPRPLPPPHSDDGGMTTFALIAIVLFLLVASAGIARSALMLAPLPKGPAPAVPNPRSRMPARCSRPSLPLHRRRTAVRPPRPPRRGPPQPRPHRRLRRKPRRPRRSRSPSPPRRRASRRRPRRSRLRRSREPQPVAAKPHSSPAAKPEPEGVAPEPAQPTPPARSAGRVSPSPDAGPGQRTPPLNPIAPVPDAARAPAQAQGEPSQAACWPPRPPGGAGVARALGVHHRVQAGGRRAPAQAGGPPDPTGLQEARASAEEAGPGPREQWRR